MQRVALRFRQRGLAILLLIVTLLIGAASVFYGLTRATNQENERARITAAALAQAKEALISYALINYAVPTISSEFRPGDLPCPDISDSGDAGTTVTALQPLKCGDDTGVQQDRRLGRLPWKTLGLPDLRDGDGERLWYAVSNNFKPPTPTTTCLTSGDPSCLNSDTPGTITVRNAAGNVIYDGSTSTGVIAVVIAPGPPLKRQGAATIQDRSCGSTGNCVPITATCNTNPESNTPKCNPNNYLDIVTGVEDNANFADGNGTNGFIQGRVLDSGGNVIVNDRIITITYEDLLPRLEQRVAMEMLNCMRIYSTATILGVTNTGRYPWTTDPASPTTPTPVADQTNALFGRVPDTLTATAAAAMPSLWPNDCNHTTGTWWNNWREHVFFAVANAYKPGAGAPAGCALGACLTVNPPNASANKQIVVMVAGRTLAGQSRTGASKQDPTNYLEGNYTPPTLTTFTKQPRSSTFNDTVVFYPP